MGTPKKGQKGGGQTPPGANTSLAKGVGGERGNIGQTKISSKREKEREQLLEPKASVSALKIRERVRSKKKGKEDRSWSWSWSPLFNHHLHQSDHVSFADPAGCSP